MDSSTVTARVLMVVVVGRRRRSVLNGPAARSQHMYAECTYLLSKCDLLTPGMRIEAAALAVGRDRVQIRVVLCDKVQNCVTI
jgi:hypothetical protein